MDCSGGAVAAEAPADAIVPDVSNGETHVQKTGHMNCMIYMNLIVLKSNIPGVKSKLFRVPSIGAPMTAEQEAEFIAKESAKMREEAATLAAAAAAADVSGGEVAATAVTGVSAVAEPQRSLERLSPDSRPVGTTGEATGSAE